MPTVSVVIPTHNRASLLQGAIESVRAQTFTDWELIVVDDGSTDSTQTNALAACHDDARIRYARKAQGGVSAARNLGIQMANGEFIAFLDDDDVWAPNKLTRQLEAFAEHPEWAFVYTQAELRYENDRVGTTREPLSGTFEELLERNTIALPAVLVRRQVLLQVGRFNEAMTTSEDRDMWLRVALLHPFGAIADVLTFCRQSRQRNEARRRTSLCNHIATLQALLMVTGERRYRLAIKRKLSKTFYKLARMSRERQDYFPAAKAFALSVKAYALAGLAWRSHNGPLIVPFLKPYAGVVECLLRGCGLAVRKRLACGGGRAAHD